MAGVTEGCEHQHNKDVKTFGGLFNEPAEPEFARVGRGERRGAATKK